MGPKQTPPWYQYLSFHSPADSDRLLCRVALQDPRVRKLVYEEHTEYVALEVNSSKSGWPPVPCMKFFK